MLHALKARCYKIIIICFHYYNFAFIPFSPPSPRFAHMLDLMMTIIAVIDNDIVKKY
jgi:hypothetical protein